MPRRLSGSIEDPDSFPKDEQFNTHHADKESFTSAKFEVMRGSDTLDRRKFEKAFDPPSPNGPSNSHPSAPASPQRYVAAFEGKPNKNAHPDSPP